LVGSGILGERLAAGNTGASAQAPARTGVSMTCRCAETGKQLTHRYRSSRFEPAQVSVPERTRALITCCEPSIFASTQVKAM
jgi:hypothetical protein